ncbi:TPA: hypothetical protein DIC38_03170 [Candidatus Nomurabacteria bacterium]|nr:MAG: hypothetical protein O210_OD1C00001G0149 [Parcubacteria bacterium RAAC4_OD1_1]HCY26653.1 hypothetical protein [Candidatus Nomurabacteria bacterium]
MTKTKIVAQTITNDIYVQKIIFKSLIFSVVLMFVVYLYLVGSITFNVLARKSLENTVKILNNNISQLEIDYFNKSNEINKEFATSRGFVDVSNSIFASRNINQVAVR